MKSLLFQDLIKVSNDLIQQPQTLNTFVIGLELNVKFAEVGNGSKNDADAGALLVIQVLHDGKNRKLSNSAVE